MLLFSYSPDLNSDPYCEDGSLWSFNYFFYNKRENKMVFLTCCATRCPMGCVCGGVCAHSHLFTHQSHHLRMYTT